MYTTDVLKKRMTDGAYDAELSKLYPSGTVDAQKKRYCRVIGEFEEFYGSSREAGLFSAPGRTEIGGNHTDHNHGRVLAASVNLDAIAVAAKGEGTVVNVKSEGYAMDTINISDLEPHEAEFGKSKALVRGVCAEFKSRGYNIGAFDAATASDVLSGSGLSSSAAFEVLLGTILNHLFNDGKVSDVEIAQIAQAAENKFFGKPCGLLDQMTSSVGSFVEIDFADPANPVIEKLDFDFASCGYALCIVDTGGSHSDLTDEYAAVRKEMESVELVEYLNKLGGANGIGLLDIVENRLVGMKSRGVYETPGGAILYKAHDVLETITLDKESMHFKAQLAQKMGELVYNGQWFTPLREAISAFTDDLQKTVTGDVKLKLYKGNMINAGVTSPYTLYDEQTASFGEDEDYNQADAAGFINLFGLSIKERAKLSKNWPEVK